MQIQSNPVGSIVSSTLPQQDTTGSASVKSERAEVAADVTTVAVKPADPKEEARQLQEAVKKINETVRSLNQDVSLEFSTDEDTKINLVRLIDLKSKEVLRQIPSEEVLNISKALDRLQGLLVREKA
jgi:flagellar protein FlaG